MGEHARYRRELAGYAIGLALALALTALAFASVAFHWLAAGPTIGLVFALGLAQIVVHFRFFLHIGLGKEARDDLQLILFSVLISALMIGGTLVVLFNLRGRMG